MAKKHTLTKQEVKEFISAYAKEKGISVEDAEFAIKCMGVSRKKALDKDQKKNRKSGSKPKKAKAPKKSKPKKAKTKKASASSRSVAEGEAG